VAKDPKLILQLLYTNHFYLTHKTKMGFPHTQSFFFHTMPLLSGKVTNAASTGVCVQIIDFQLVKIELFELKIHSISER